MTIAPIANGEAGSSVRTKLNEVIGIVSPASPPTAGHVLTANGVSDPTFQAAVAGPTGATGPAGATGSAGPTGATGPTGPSGGGGGSSITTTLTASGSLAAGTAVSMNASGAGVQTWGPAPDIANVATLFAAPMITIGPGLSQNSPGVLGLSASQFVAFQPNNGSSFVIGPQPGAVAFSLAGDVISVGSPSASGGLCKMQACAALDGTHFVYAYFDGSENVQLQAGSVSANTISLGSAVKAADAPGTLSNPLLRCGFAILSASEFVFTYADAGNQAWYVVGTVSGTTITLGAPANTGLPVAQICQLFVLGIDASNVVLAWLDPGAANIVTAAVGSVSGTTLTLHTPATIALSSGNGGAVGVFGVAVDAAHFCLTWSDNSPLANQCLAAAGSISGTSITFGSGVVVNTNWYEQLPFIAVLNSSTLAFYVAATTPTIAALSGATLTPTLGAPLPIAGGHTASVIPGQWPDFSSNVWPSMAACGTNLFFTNGLWEVFEESSAGVISPPVAHPGIISYAFAPISSSKVLALLIDGASNILARVINFAAISNGPIGFTASAVTNGNPITVVTAGDCGGFTGLTPGTYYYVNGDGTVTTANTGHPGGFATSTTQLTIAPAP